MKVLGLILEANPLHNGHIYFINKAKELVKPDVVIAVTSTYFSMRGDISVINKFDKTNLLLQSGIDIVLELPFTSTNASADYFSYNAVKTLVDMKVTDIVFGSECDSINELRELQKLDEYLGNSSEVKSNLSKGYSYSTSTFKALSNYSNDLDLINKFALPNNTLGIQYLNAIDKLNKDINVQIIKRIDNNYYDNEINNAIASATALRTKLFNNESIDEFVPFKVSYIDINEAENNLYHLFQYKLLSTDINEIKEIHGIKEGIENRLISFIDSTNYQEFIKNVETKRYTKSYIKRIILNIILGLKKTNQLVSHLRILGMNQQGKKYIGKLDKETKEKLITNIKDIDSELIKYELLSSKIYGIILNSSSIYKEEYKLPIILKGEKDA